MLRYGKWHSYDAENQWLSFDALKFVHRVQPVTEGCRYSITLYTPGKLERLTAQDWDKLGQAGFPIYLYEPLPAKMRRLTTPTHVDEAHLRSQEDTVRKRQQDCGREAVVP